MNDQIIMENYLLVLKSTVEVYVHGTLESSNKSIRELLKNGLDKTMNFQGNLYDEMTKYNWYQVNNIKSSDIKKVYDNLTKKN